MKKNKVFAWGVLAILLALVSVPAFAEEPMTISGVWRRDNPVGSRMGGADGEIDYYYFSPGGVDGTAVGVAVLPDIVGGQQIIPFKGTWDFEEKDGKQLFCVYRVSIYYSGRFIDVTPFPAQRVYRFYTENGTQKMEFGEGDRKEIWTKIGTNLSDLPELGPLGYEDMTGGRFWAAVGVVVR